MGTSSVTYGSTHSTDALGVEGLPNDELFPQEEFTALATQAANAHGFDPEMFARFLNVIGANSRAPQTAGDGSRVVQGIHTGLLQSSPVEAWQADILPYTEDELTADPALAFDLAGMHLAKLQNYSADGTKGAVEMFLGDSVAPDKLALIFGEGATFASGQASELPRDGLLPLFDDVSAQSSTTQSQAQGGFASFAPGLADGNARALAQWVVEIDAAASIVGSPAIDPFLIGAMVWAESSGNPGHGTTNRDGNTDYGLMQISQSRIRDRVAELKTSDPQRFNEINARSLKQLGVGLDSLDVTDPAHNLVAGALHLDMWIKTAGGNTKRGLAGYVTGNVDSNGPYPKNVLLYQAELSEGKTNLSRDVYGTQTAEQNAAGVFG